MFNKKSKIELTKDLKKESFERITCSFYRYCEIDNPEELRDTLYQDLSDLNILGRIYVASEGINAQISIPEHKWNNFQDYISTLSFLTGIKLKKAVQEGISFIKLTIKVKEEIVAYNIPKDTYDMNKVGKHLSAKEFNQSIDDKDSIVVDIRNYYESEVGKFEGAVTPDVDRSKELLPEVAELLADKKDKKLHLYCTGGIRCEKASSYLLKQGFKEVYQLDGGIIQYAHDVKKEGLSSKFIGKNFVFDSRLGERITEDIIGKCHQCGEKADSHTNCANDACHILFIQCEACATKYSACCSTDCEDFSKLDMTTQKELRKDVTKTVSSGKLSSKIKPKLYKLFDYWK
ncbi:MAG: rhodanese-related sulfurtransferase [Candidatus Neomarinimicrobiota bacterium]|nr:rhodanese-related sulfurtransferase [Candidatus Neomarinimicrobiota bacterium]